MLSEDSSRRISYTRSMESVAQGALGSLLSVTSLEAGDYQVSECAAAAPPEPAGLPAGWLLLAATCTCSALIHVAICLFVYIQPDHGAVYLFTFSLTTWARFRRRSSVPPVLSRSSTILSTSSAAAASAVSSSWYWQTCWRREPSSPPTGGSPTGELSLSYW